ncbi:hypothetical protein VTK26DRAFT_4292 [Humicola hyalothermophila]
MHFLSLPTDLREQILSCICLFPNGVHVDILSRRISSRPAVVITYRSNNDDNNNNSSNSNSPVLSTTDSLNLSETGIHQPPVDARPPTNLFLACRALYREASHLYYGRNAFCFDYPSSVTLCTAFARRAPMVEPRQRRRHHHHHHHYHPCDESTVSAQRRLLISPGGGGCARELLMRSPARLRVRSVAVRIPSLAGSAGELVADLLVSLLSRLVRSGDGGRDGDGNGDGNGDDGGLQRLEVVVADALRGMGWGREEPDPGEKGNLWELLGLLMMGGSLRETRLRVPRGWHAPWWCRFHRGRCGMVADCQRTPGFGNHGEDHDDDDDDDDYDDDDDGDLLDVDIHELVEVYGARGVCGGTLSVEARTDFRRRHW